MKWNRQGVFIDLLWLHLGRKLWNHVNRIFFTEAMAVYIEKLYEEAWKIEVNNVCYSFTVCSIWPIAWRRKRSSGTVPSLRQPSSMTLFTQLFSKFYTNVHIAHSVVARCHWFFYLCIMSPHVADQLVAPIYHQLPPTRCNSNVCTEGKVRTTKGELSVCIVRPLYCKLIHVRNQNGELQ